MLTAILDENNCDYRFSCNFAENECLFSVPQPGPSSVCNASICLKFGQVVLDSV